MTPTLRLTTGPAKAGHYVPPTSGPYVLVLQRQTDFITAQGREIDAQADLSVAAAELRRATGTTLEARGVGLR